MSRRLTDLEREKKICIENNKLMQAKLEKYRSIAWIDQQVRKNFGMTYNVKRRIVLFDVPSGQTDTDRGLFASLSDFIVKVFKSLVKD